VPAAFNPIAKEFKVTKQQASYLTTTYTLFGGITPLLITPYVNLYGRRPAYIVCSIEISCIVFGSECKFSIVIDHYRHRQQYRICVCHNLWRGDRFSYLRGRRCKRRAGNWCCHGPFLPVPLHRSLFTLTTKCQICDMFFQGERGRFMGFYALAITNGVCVPFSYAMVKTDGCEINSLTSVLSRVDSSP
jgi:hypothetical protein